MVDFAHTLVAIPITDIQSDRICGIRLKWMPTNDDVTWLSIIGVYLPCLDLGVDLHRQSLIELERIISISEHLGPTVIAGDFNAHLGSHWGPRGSPTTNARGVLVGELLERCHLHTVSLNAITTGPQCTYRQVW